MTKARLRPMRSPTLLPMRMNAADTSASSAMAPCTPLTVVPRSSTTFEIDTFISDVSTTSTNMAAASSTLRRLSAAADRGSSAAVLPVSGDDPPPPPTTDSPELITAAQREGAACATTPPGCRDGSCAAASRRGGWRPRGRVPPGQQELADLRSHDDRQRRSDADQPLVAGQLHGVEDPPQEPERGGQDDRHGRGQRGDHEHPVAERVQAEDRAPVVARREREEQIRDR